MPDDSRDDEPQSLDSRHGVPGEGGEPLPGGRPNPDLRPHGDHLAARLADAEDDFDVDDDEAYADEGREEPPGAAALPRRRFGRGGSRGLGPVRLLAFYDRLRGAVAGTLERRGGRLGRPVADALLLVPDVFMLLARLALDREVPAQTRTLIGGALAYFVVPLDLLPEAFVGAAGFVDDLVLGAAVLSQVMSPELAAKAQRYWSGREDVLRVLRDIAGTAHSLLGEDLLGRLRSLLARRGVVLEGAGDSRSRLADRGDDHEDEEELGASGDVGRSPYH